MRFTTIIGLSTVIAGVLLLPGLVLGVPDHVEFEKPLVERLCAVEILHFECEPPECIDHTCA